jgi:hypothetical protein
MLLELEVDGGVLMTTSDHSFWSATDGEFQRGTTSTATIVSSPLTAAPS